MRESESVPVTEWKLQGDQLVLVVNGTIEEPTADEIYARVFEGDSSLQSYTLDVLGNGPLAIDFNQFPAELEAQIDFIESVAGASLALSISAKGKGHSRGIASLRRRVAD